jgi:MbtH protein
MSFDDETAAFNVLANHEGQYSLWPLDREIPSGWRPVEMSGSKAECLAYIEEVWTDMRPLSLRSGPAAGDGAGGTPFRTRPI